MILVSLLVMVCNGVPAQLMRLSDTTLYPRKRCNFDAVVVNQTQGPLSWMVRARISILIIVLRVFGRNTPVIPSLLYPTTQSELLSRFTLYSN